jgi:hypothetical protein
VLLYDYAVRDKIDALLEYALNMRVKFEAGTPAATLLLDAESLRSQYNSLKESLPAEIRDVSRFGQHAHFLVHYLKQDSLQSCASDIRDICEHDIPGIEKAFREWCKQAQHYDSELLAAVSDLVLRQNHDSAIRKAFVILTERLRAKFHVPDTFDGTDLVNRIFGSAGCHGTSLSQPESQTFRDLLAGLYGTYRNPHAHKNTNPSWAESDGIISMINLILLDLARL